MKLITWLILSPLAFALLTVYPTNYKVIPMDSREVIVSCTNGAQPLVSTQEDKPNLIEIKCLDTRQ